MRLKHLHLQGYKTFATKTEFQFPSGITAIVGPNGSGKSNIADAVRWVLGEQSYTTLRGKRTEDMIYSGSQTRSRAGMAEVTLTLDNSDGQLPIEFSEVTLGRRAYRDGQNEYRLNSNRVRLRDILELLSQSGLSRRTYTIIGQGVVDSVLSLRAEERRELFEEAAGISHYRIKRDDALRKLDETQRNLERVHDIISEIEPRLRHLKQQAVRAREHDQLSSNLEQLLRVWYGYRWGQASLALNRAQHLARQRAQQHRERSQSLQNLADKLDQLRQARSDLRGQLGDWHGESSRLHTQAENDQRELAVLAERNRQLSAQREEQLGEITKLDAHLIAQTERIAQARTALTVTQETLAQRESEVQATHAALNARLTTRDALLKTRQDAQERLSVLRAEIAERQSRWETLDERIETLHAQIKADQTASNNLTDGLAAHSSQLSQLEAELAQFAAEDEKIQRTLKGLETQRQALAAKSEREQADLHRLRETEAEVAARFELLGQLRRDLAVYGQAVRALLSAARSTEDESAKVLSGAMGVLGQMVQVPADQAPDVSTAVEAALGGYASAIVVRDWQTAANALQHLQSTKVDGRVIFLALESPPASSPPSSPARGDWLLSEPLSSQVQCDEALRPLMNRLLGRAYLVPDLAAARSALPYLPPGGLCVTPGGEVLRSDGALEGGRSAEQASPLAQEREWSQLNTRRIELGAQRETSERTVRQTKTALERIREQLEQSNALLEQLRARQSAASALRDQITREADRLRHEIDWRNSQITKSEDDLTALRRRQDELTGEIDQRTQAQAQATAKIQETATRLETLPVEMLSDNLTVAQMAVATAKQTQHGQQNILLELTNSLSRLREDRDTRLHRVTELEHEEKSVTERISQLNQRQGDVTARLEAFLARIEPTEARLVEFEEEQTQLEAQERLERARLREFEGHLTNARIAAQRREDELNQLRGRIEEDLGLVELELGPSVPGQTPLPLHPLVSKLPVVQQLPEGVQDEIKRLRLQLRRLGAINPSAPQDYKETRERYSFLQEQSVDLTEASESLRKVIAEMDGLIEHAFRQTFEAVASQFSTNFTSLFDGGKAQLELTAPDELSQTGVEIVAQPPGKRLQALASLSGGERALTAVALVFAILQVSPPPFCFLDEVDAMLDEANIGRFRSMLESLTDHTQIVIITHNRGTITAADTVYGVSMGADSASQVYSIRMQGDRIKET